MVSLFSCNHDFFCFLHRWWLIVTKGVIGRLKVVICHIYQVLFLKLKPLSSTSKFHVYFVPYTILTRQTSWFWIKVLHVLMKSAVLSLLKKWGIAGNELFLSSTSQKGRNLCLCSWCWTTFGVCMRLLWKGENIYEVFMERDTMCFGDFFK